MEVAIRSRPPSATERLVPKSDSFPAEKDQLVVTVGREVDCATAVDGSTGMNASAERQSGAQQHENAAASAWKCFQRPAGERSVSSAEAVAANARFCACCADVP